MKQPQQVKVIASIPFKGQESIENIIGSIFPVKFYDKEDQSVSVDSNIFGGEIILNESEYQIIE